MKQFFLFFLLLSVWGINIPAYAKPNDSAYIETPVTLHTNTGNIFGTLTTPVKFTVIPATLIIAGSGPTDRNGNNSYMKNDGLKKLAQGLAMANIASLRFDKRGIGESSSSGKSEANLRFDDYISDAKAWIALLQKDNRFSTITVTGHSEGSLIGMIAAQNADKFISLAGAGQAADLIIKDQFSTQPQSLKDIAFPILDSLKAGHLVGNVDPSMNAIFRASVQPYMISWFKYDPQAEIKKLKVPVLLIQGTKDIQVSVEEANRLAKAKPDAKLVLIENMNHVLKIVTGDRDANIKAYSDSTLPLSEELLKAIIAFIIAK